MARRTKQNSGSGGLLDQVTGMVGKSGRRGSTGGGGLPGKVTSFMAGFMSGGDNAKRGRRGRRGAGGRRRGGGRRR